MTSTPPHTTRDGDGGGFEAPYPAPTWLHGPVLLPPHPVDTALDEETPALLGPFRPAPAPTEVEDT